MQKIRQAQTPRIERGKGEMGSVVFELGQFEVVHVWRGQSRTVVVLGG